MLLTFPYLKQSAKMYKALEKTIQELLISNISEERKELLQELINYIQSKIDANSLVQLNFICTHNSRRSQFSQIWAQTAAHFYKIPAQNYSGGVEGTAFNERAVKIIKKAGFKVEKIGTDNPAYSIFFSNHAEPILTFSKVFNDPSNPKEGFAAIMTCSHADENCPFIAGAEARIPVRYEDPKAFDDTGEEAAKYWERSIQIATEMFYVFSQIKKL
jgi:arsenate reductase